MASVSVSGIQGTANEIQGVNDTLKSASTQTATSCNTISKLAAEFASYNGQTVADSITTTTSSDSSYRYHYKEYDTWVTTTGGLSAKASYLANKAEQINGIVGKINKEVADTQTIAVAIQGYIDSIQDILSNSDTMSKYGINISSGVVASAFLALGRDGVSKANLATSGADINSRNFLDYDSIKDDEKLNGGLLSFEKQDDGSYLIKKDGESTGYYTTGLAAGLYMKTLVSGVSKEATTKYQAKVKNSVDTKNNIEGNQEKSSLKGEEALNNVKKGFSSIVDETKENFKNFTEGTANAREKINDSINSFKDSLSSNSSNDAIQIDYPNNTNNLTTEYKARWQDDLFSQSLMGKQDYVVPEGKNLYVKNQLIAKSGDTLKYNSSSSTYSVLSSEGTKRNLANYSSKFLSNGAFSDVLVDDNLLKK